MFHEPTRGLRTEKDANSQDERRDKRRTKLETPSDAAGVFNDDIGSKAQKDTCGRLLALSQDEHEHEHEEGAHQRLPKVART
jgi:hypothetical protein